jgi:hypothetical protein
MFHRIAGLMLCAMLSACMGNVRFEVPSPGPAPTVDLQVTDARPALSRRGGKGRFFSFHYYHGDAVFAPSRLTLFDAAVTAAFPSPPSSISLRKFDVVDSFARRRGAAQAAAMASVSYSMAVAMDASRSSGSDYILCEIEADVDGRQVIGSAYAPYKESASSLNVMRDASYVAATTKAISEALAAWIENAKADLPNSTSK